MSDLQNYIKIIEASILTEKLLEIDDDIDRIYDTYFKQIINAIQENKFTTPTEFITYAKENTVTTSLDEMIKSEIVQSDELIMLAEKVPNSTLVFNDPMHSGAKYVPKEYKVLVSIHLEAVLLLINHDYDFGKLENVIPSESFESFKSEFTEEKIKGSIHHELAHFYDNVMHGKHIENWIDKRYKRYKKDINTTKFEIEGIIHTIKQFKKKFDDWDYITFDEMIQKIPSLSEISRKLKNEKPLEREYWMRKIKQRMAREGLLGNEMR